MSRAIYPGSFDPVTFGHIDIIKRSAAMFDELIVGVLNNNAKSPLFDVAVRTQMLEEAVCDLQNVSVICYDVIVRGLRAITDFDYELQIAQSNRVVSKHHIDTVFLSTSLEYAYLSSSMVREYASYGTDVSSFVPDFVQKRLKERFKK